MTAARCKIRVKPAPGIDLSGAQIISLANCEFYIPLLAIGVICRIEPTMQRCGQSLSDLQVRFSAVSRDAIDDMCDVIHAGLCRGYPWITLADIVEMPVSLQELLTASSRIIQVAYGQTGSVPNG